MAASHLSAESISCMPSYTTASAHGAIAGGDVNVKAEYHQHRHTHYHLLKNDALLTDSASILEKAVKMLIEHTQEQCAASAHAESEMERLSQAVYVPPSGQVFNSPASAVPLFERMDAFLEDMNKRVAVVLGSRPAEFY